MVAEFDLGILSDVTAYPYRLHLEQHRLTPIQLDILRKQASVQVHFGHRVTGFEQKGERLKVASSPTAFPALSRRRG
jgi:3-(3-hydroxy-phenyl)propionate hydroxylase